MKNPYNKEQRGCWQLLKRTVLGCVVVLLVPGCRPTRASNASLFTGMSSKTKNKRNYLMTREV